VVALCICICSSFMCTRASKTSSKAPMLTPFADGAVQGGSTRSEGRGSERNRNALQDELLQPSRAVSPLVPRAVSPSAAV
jgi:hypothetical protein